jgi:ATPase subunit of ABC transporter with duplicated ATPase domains
MQITTWNYDESVKRVLIKVQEWKAVSLKKSTLTAEICKDLYEAREQLSDRGSRPKWDDSYNWTNYLRDVGLASSTVHRWLEYYEPQEQRLLSDNELEQRKREEKRKQMEHEQAVKDKVKERIQTNAVPKDWDAETEQMYQEKLNQEQKNKEWKERIQKESQKRESRNQSYDFKSADESINNMKELLDELATREAKKEQLAGKMRLTGNNADHEFNQMLIDYLEGLDNDSQRLEACHNGIKIFKAYIRDHNLVRA